MRKDEYILKNLRKLHFGSSNLGFEGLFFGGGEIRFRILKKQIIISELNRKIVTMEPLIKNDFEYVLVIDFEATCEDGQKLKPCSEIIEFPVRAIRLADGQLLDTPFHYYVRPVFHPKLSKFCTELTGITQDKVDGGQKLENILELFEVWLKQNNINNFVFVTCGDWDLKTCLKYEAKEKKIVLPEYFKQFINVKKIFPCPPDKNPATFKVFGMTHMLEILKIPLDGRHHSGIDDTFNIAKVVIELLKKGVKFDKAKVSTV